MVETSREGTFVSFLSDEEEDRLRVAAFIRKRRVLRFLVQYECLLRGEWRPIVRYDTTHGFAHKDLVHHGGGVSKKPLSFQDFNTALTFAIQELKASWKWYRLAYEREVEDEEGSSRK
jgi:hypothetical protein